MQKQRTVTMDEELWETVQSAIYHERERLNNSVAVYTEIMVAKNEVLKKLGKASGLIMKAREREE